MGKKDIQQAGFCVRVFYWMKSVLLASRSVAVTSGWMVTRDLCVTVWRRRPSPRMGLRLLLAVLLVCCAYRMWYTSEVVVFWEDDAIAAKEPYTYEFSSSSRHSFPGVSVSQVSVKCLPRGAATVIAGGRLGNLIMEFASLWTAARIHNLSAFVSPGLYRRLLLVFEPLGLPDTSEFLSQSSCPKDAMQEVTRRVLSVDLKSTPLAAAVTQAKQQHLPIIFERYIVLPETIVPLVDEVRRHFRYQLNLWEYANKKLRLLRKRVLLRDSSIKEVVFVGVHVRRTDYTSFLQELYGSVKPADERYYGQAALWLNSTVVPQDAKLVLVVVSDDPLWVEEVLLPHLHAVGMWHSFLVGDSNLYSPQRDLALLSACNHSVIAYGTFGLWSALMAGGHAVVYHFNHRDAMSPTMQFAKHLPGWVAMSLYGP